MDALLSCKMAVDRFHRREALFMAEWIAFAGITFLPRGLVAECLRFRVFTENKIPDHKMKSVQNCLLNKRAACKTSQATFSFSRLDIGF